MDKIKNIENLLQEKTEQLSKHSMRRGNIIAAELYDQNKALQTEVKILKQVVKILQT